MAKLEEEISSEIELKPFLWWRYKDDIFFLWEHGEEKLKESLGINMSRKSLKENFMPPFYGWGSTVSKLEPLRQDSLLFTTKFPEIPGTHFIDLGRMKG